MVVSLYSASLPRSDRTVVRSSVQEVVIVIYVYRINGIVVPLELVCNLLFFQTDNADLGIRATYCKGLSFLIEG